MQGLKFIYVDVNKRYVPFFLCVFNISSYIILLNKCTLYLTTDIDNIQTIFIMEMALKFCMI